MEREKIAEERRIERDKKLKAKISEFQMIKMQQDKIDVERRRDDENKKAQRDELR